AHASQQIKQLQQKHLAVRIDGPYQKGASPEASRQGSQPDKNLQNACQRLGQHFADHHASRSGGQQHGIHQLGGFFHQHAGGDSLSVEKHHKIQHHNIQVGQKIRQRFLQSA